jgi:hypothetical protein
MPHSPGWLKLGSVKWMETPTGPPVIAQSWLGSGRLLEMDNDEICDEDGA